MKVGGSWVFEFIKFFTNGLYNFASVIKFHLKMHDFIDILEFPLIS